MKFYNCFYDSDPLPSSYHVAFFTFLWEGEILKHCMLKRDLCGGRIRSSVDLWLEVPMAEILKSCSSLIQQLLCDDR